jgi:hypothetical protein
MSGYKYITKHKMEGSLWFSVIVSRGRNDLNWDPFLIQPNPYIVKE